ncbi:hypothetical protein ACFPRL_07180 [Pseudoclavibacter helvolus]
MLPHLGQVREPAPQSARRNSGCGLSDLAHPVALPAVRRAIGTGV